MIYDEIMFKSKYFLVIKSDKVISKLGPFCYKDLI